ncbi:KEA2 [Symbiodinium natans]|uniref:KEA2 protein n=1 Tax=Symbiodinium natans TaxID=878477 RepID=A0A812TQ74_9DINO|nr:KEA2 [Symbiodinium natans]
MAWPARLLASALVGLGTAGQEVPALLCANVTQSRFDPDCLPPGVREYSDVGQVGKDPPYVYLQWMLAETCGIHMAEFKTQFATLPQVLSRGMKSVFLNFFVYVIGNFLAVGAMSIFYIAPQGRRCWGLFRVGSMGYKRLVGPMYFVLMALAAWIAVGLAYRFFTELHAFRQLVHQEAKRGSWPLQSGGRVQVPSPSVACVYVFELRWVTYRHCFDILVLMTFTSMDLIACIFEFCWTCLIACFAYCRCLCCFWCKGCCGICGWMICNCSSAVCCLLPIALLFLYIVSGLVGATILCTLLLAAASGLLVAFSLGLRYALAALTGWFCKPLPLASWVDQVMLLHPLPPGSPYFTTAMVVREPMNEDERINDLKLQEATPLASSFDVDEAHMSSDYTIWENHLGMPMHILNYAFPAWYTMTFIPSVLMIVVAISFLRSNEILFAKSMAESDLAWLPAGPISTWQYHWVVLQAVFEGVTDGFRGIFVDVPVALVTAPKSTAKHVWDIAEKGIDVVNLFKADRRESPTEPLDDGQFKGNFDDFESTVVLLRLVLTMLFGCLRLTAIIARTPDESDSQEDEGDEEEDEESSDENGVCLA